MPYKKNITAKKRGLSPGTLVYTGSKQIKDYKLSCLLYDENEVSEIQNFSLNKLETVNAENKTVWINLEGIQHPEIMDSIGRHFSIHSLVLEDIMNVFQRPKIDDYENYLFIVVKSIDLLNSSNTVTYNQISMILGKNYVITFQDANDDDIISPIKERILNNIGRIRKSGPDYLIYRILDQIIDNYFAALENIGEKIETVEDELLSNPVQDTSKKINNLKREMLSLRRSVWPLREMLNNLIKNESALIDKASYIFLRDLYDHVTQIIDIIENDRELISGLLDIYLSSLSNKMNEIMKVLTIISTIFIPLTFIAGIYGMNFNPAVSPFNMPEINLYYGYPAVMLLMIVITLLMILFFKRKKWL